MYQILADDTLIYDSTIEDYKIAAGTGTLETNKAGSFNFTLFHDHFFYHRFVKKRTVVQVNKSGRVLFRGRLLDDKADNWNRKNLICEGERNFLQDSTIRPYTLTGTPGNLFTKILTEHNAQLDDFKAFRIGQVTVIDPEGSREYTVSSYNSALENLSACLLETFGGYLHITHGENGTDPIPTLHYLADITDISSQPIEFGVNLRDYAKTGTGQEIVTAIIPLSVQEDKTVLDISSVNNGLDYVYDAAAVAVHGWVYKPVYFEEVTDPTVLKNLGLDALTDAVKEEVSVELTALDMHLLDRSIESYGYDTYVRCISTPHGFAETLLCHKQTFNLLQPQNDSVVLGGTCRSLTGSITKLEASNARKISGLQSTVTSMKMDISTNADGLAKLNYKTAAYQLAEQQLTSLMAQSFGLFKTEEAMADGSTVHYLHNKPTLAASDTVWKMTGDTFTVSTDGGKTWNAGLTSSGKAILNALAVIGIEATWINCDNLSALSANLGGWLIDGTKIYKVIQHPTNSKIRYRVYLKPPIPSSGTVKTEIITCEISRDSGSTWTDLLVLDADGTAVFHSENKGTYKIHGSFMELVDVKGVQVARIGTQSRTSVENGETVVEEEPLVPYGLIEEEGSGDGVGDGGLITEEPLPPVIEEEPLLPEVEDEELIVDYESDYIPEVVLTEDSDEAYQAVVNPTCIQLGDRFVTNRAFLKRNSDGKYILRVEAIEIRDNNANKMAYLKYDSSTGEYVLKVDRISANNYGCITADCIEVDGDVMAGGVINSQYQISSDGEIFATGSMYAASYEQY